jgi:anti-sigma factor RsiW
MTAFEKNCPVEDIAAYIDGELDAAREAEVECSL